MSQNRVITLVGLAVIALALFASGCLTEQQAQDQARQARETLEPAVEDLERIKAGLGATIADPEAEPDAVAEAQEALDTVEQQLAVATKALEVAIAIEADPSGDTILGQVVNTVLPFLPEPYRLPLALGVPLLASLARAWQLKRAGREVARGVQVAAEADAALKQRIQENAGLIRLNQGATARRLVDEAQGKKPARLL
jgi:exonuclease VII small subunit